MRSDSPTSLEQLYRDFLATGNEASLELWMRRSSPTLRRQAMRLGVSGADADDLLQETFVAAIQGADRYERSRPIMPWLKGILTFRAARMARDEVRRRRLYEASRPARRSAADVSEESFGELDRDVRQAIDDLPEHYREPLLQHLLADRSPVEIATNLGVARATVRVRLHRGLRKLRDALQRWALLVAATMLGRRASAAVTASLAFVAIAAWIAVAVQDAAPPASDQVVQLGDTLRTSGSSRPRSANATNTIERMAEQSAVVATAGSARPETAALTVLVQDASGDAMPCVGLTLEPRAAQDPVLHRRGKVTDREGRASWASLPAGTWTLRTDRGQQASVESSGGSLLHRFEVPDQPLLDGFVVDPSGSPVPNARIWLSGDTNGPWRGQDVAQTDASGRFELRGVPEGAFLAARHAHLARSPVHRVRRAAQRAHAAPVRLQLGAPSARMRVRVTDAQGAPAPAATVHIGDSMDAEPLWLAQGAAPWRPPPYVARTDARGFFETGALAAGAHPVFVRAVGYAPHRSTAVMPAAVTKGAVTTGATMATNGWFRHSVQLLPGAQLAGQVRNEIGDPVPNAMVAFRHAQQSNSIDLRTDARGTFELQCLPAGNGDVFAKASGHVAAVSSVALGPKSHRSIQITLPRAQACAGRVTIGGLSAPVGTQVRTEWPPHALRDQTIITATDPAGRFGFTGRGLQRPRFLVRMAHEPIWRDATPFVHWVDPVVEIRLPATFAATNWIHGRCTSDDGEPISGARIFVHRDHKRWTEVGRTDEQGNYRIGPLPAPGYYRVFAESTKATQPTVCGSWLPVLANANADTEANLTAAGTGDVIIKLSRNDGQPVRDVLMTVQRSDLARRFAVSNVGRMRQRLEAGDYILSVMGSSVQWIDRHAFTVQPGATTQVAVQLRAASQCTLLPVGFPKRDEDKPTEVLLRATHGPAWQATVSLLPGAPLRIGAVLPPGSYTMSHTATDEDLVTWRGTFSIGSEQHATAPLVVPMDSIGPGHGSGPGHSSKRAR